MSAERPEQQLQPVTIFDEALFDSDPFAARQKLLSNQRNMLESIGRRLLLENRVPVDTLIAVKDASRSYFSLRSKVENLNMVHEDDKRIALEDLARGHNERLNGLERQVSENTPQDDKYYDTLKGFGWYIITSERMHEYQFTPDDKLKAVCDKNGGIPVQL